MIDLAGSERAAYTNNKGIRMIEGANINKSLLALANCITKLADIQKGKPANYVPYRDSKLTRLLKESLCGNCRTVMITNVSPAITGYEDTSNTLKYANRAKSIKTYQKKNIKGSQDETSQHMVSEYADIISSLKKENQQLKSLVQKRKCCTDPESLSIPSPSPGASADRLSEETVGVIQNMEKKILQAFQSETEALTRLFTAEDNIDNLKQSIVKSFGKLDENTRSYLQNLKLRKMQFEEERQRAQEGREVVLREIEALPKNQFPYQYSMSLFEKEHTKTVGCDSSQEELAGQAKENRS